LTYENKKSRQLYLLIQDQVRVAGFGHVIGLDLGAVIVVFKEIGVKSIEKELWKMKLFHHYLVQENQKKEK
jgi:hypothetical protein